MDIFQEREHSMNFSENLLWFEIKAWNNFCYYCVYGLRIKCVYLEYGFVKWYDKLITIKCTVNRYIYNIVRMKIALFEQISCTD